MNENERPELGTTEAAVRSCVNLIALATCKSEGQIAYWLDCYYQLRVAHEKTAPTLDFSQLMNAQEPVLVKLDELEKQIGTLNKRFSWLPPFQSDVEDGPPRASAPTEEDDGRQVAAPTEDAPDSYPQPTPPIEIKPKPIGTFELDRTETQEKPKAAAAQKKTELR